MIRRLFETAQFSRRAPGVDQSGVIAFNNRDAAEKIGNRVGDQILPHVHCQRSPNHRRRRKLIVGRGVFRKVVDLPQRSRPDNAILFDNSRLALAKAVRLLGT
jgi:hypothetical protein